RGHPRTLDQPAGESRPAHLSAAGARCGDPTVRIAPPLRRAVPLLCILSGGCSGLFHSSACPEQTYYLRAPPAAAATLPLTAARGAPGSPPALAASLRVGHPQADPGLDSSHIMLVQADHRMNFYAGSRWPGPVADLIEALAVETLRASDAWRSVEDSTSPFPSDYLLQVAVRRFEADYTAGGTVRSEEHTSELQSPCNIVCRLLLEKKKNNRY